jgi:class 3 adenylate cyclase
MMKFIERVILYLFPNLLFANKDWLVIWRNQERKEFVSAVRVFFGITAIVYVLHYFTVDRSEGLAPSDLWFNYRFGMAGTALVCLLLYSYNKFTDSIYYKIPTFIACALFCYFQTRTIVWYPKVPYLYSFGFVLISSLMVRSTILVSVLYAIGLLSLIWPTLIEANQSASMMFSASSVTIIFIVYMKAKYVSDINLFIANQKNTDSQKKIIEINMEFTDQIKSFLPAEISKRLTFSVQDQRMSVLQAIDEVLRPRKTNIACLFSDVRGFTKGSNDLNGFVAQSLLPNLKSSTVAVERFKGIPRKIGDLIFAYYDLEDFHENIRNLLKSALEISILNSELNSELPDNLRVNRFILLSVGEAVVGNLSGYDSNIEITAIGRPVNLLSRLDEVTKIKALRDNLAEGDIIISTDAAKIIKIVYPELSLTMISLEALNIKVRDFEHEIEIYVLPLTKKNYQVIFGNKTFLSKKKNAEAA